MLHRSARAVLLVLTVTSCRTSFLGFGVSAAEARRHASDGLQSHALRFDDVVRDTKSTNARQQISRYALTPSRLYGDSSVWTDIGQHDSTRGISIAGNYDHQRKGYTFRASPSLEAPFALADARHVMRLAQLPDGGYSWDTSVEHGIGAMPPASAGRAFSMFFASAESPAARDLRTESRLIFPRTARALGRLFSLDSALSRPLPDGSAVTSAAVRWHSDRLRATMPYFAAYIAKYIEPSKYLVRLSDARGRTYLDVTGDRGLLLVRWRSRGGQLLPLEGGSVPMPDTLRIRLDFKAKYRMFRVGFAELVGDFVIQRGARASGWMMRFRQEPKWQLPLFTETLIRTPLRRPFQGRGAELYLALRDDLGRQTMLVRRAHVEVKESAILRWMGGLGATAMSDFQGQAEAEQNRFLRDAFVALRADLHDLLPAGPEESSP